MGNNSCSYYLSTTGQPSCTSDTTNDTIINIGIIVGIVIGSLAGISIIICMILVTCIIMKRFNSLSIAYSSLENSQSINPNNHQ